MYSVTTVEQLWNSCYICIVLYWYAIVQIVCSLTLRNIKLWILTWWKSNLPQGWRVLVRNLQWTRYWFLPRPSSFIPTMTDQCERWKLTGYYVNEIDEIGIRRDIVRKVKIFVGPASLWTFDLTGAETIKSGNLTKGLGVGFMRPSTSADLRKTTDKRCYPHREQPLSDACNPAPRTPAA